MTYAPAYSGMGGTTDITLNYDLAGNLSIRNGQTLTWDGWGRLTGVGSAISYGYDSAGRRVRKTVSGVSTYFLYAGNTLLAELDASGNVKRAYTWGATGLISHSTPVLHPPRNGITRFYFFDALGNTRFLVDVAGSVTERASWGAWGEGFGLTTTSAFGWKGAVGQYRDSETGLIYLNARYYSPALGRFLSRDPIGFLGGTNLYAYCHDDPVNFFDFDGTDADEIVGRLTTAARIYNFVSAVKSIGPLRDTFAGLGTMEGQNDACVGSVPSGDLWRMRAKAFYGFGKTALALARPITMAVETGFNTIYANGSGALDMDGCFVAGTPVQVAVPDAKSKSRYRQIRKPIELVKAGDLVASRDEHTGKSSFKRVQHTTVRQVDVAVAVTLADARSGRVVEVITTTRNHPFYVRDKGFVPAGGLAIGNAIVTRAGPPVVVKSLKWLKRAEGYTVYNFEVEEDHTYFVGTAHGGIWVHNPEDCPTPIQLTRPPAGLGRAIDDLENSGSATVATRAQAEEVFYRVFGNRGYFNTTGFEDVAAQRYFGTDRGTYHWDEVIDTDPKSLNFGLLLNHEGPDAYQRHVQIHTFEHGDILRIFFGPRLP